MTQIAESPIKKLKKFLDQTQDKKHKIFMKRFKRLNEKISVAKYPKDEGENMEGVYYFPDMEEILGRMRNDQFKQL